MAGVKGKRGDKRGGIMRELEEEKERGGGRRKREGKEGTAIYIPTNNFNNT